MEVTFARNCAFVHSKTAVSVCFSPSGRLLASTGSDKSVTIHNVSDGSLVYCSNDEHLAGVNQVGWLNDRLIVTAADDGLVRIKNIVENSLLRVFRLPNKSVPYCFAIHPINGLITVGDNIGGVTSFHLHHSEVLQHFDAHGKGITTIQYSSDGSELATGSQDGIVRQWVPDPDPVCFQTIVPCPRVFTCISSLTYSDDGKHILVSTLDSSQRLFPRHIPKEERQRDSAVLQVYKGHVNKKYAVSTHILPSYLLQKRYVLSACDKGKLYIWDMGSGNLLLSILAHKGPIYSITVHSVLSSNNSNSPQISNVPSTLEYEFIVASTGRDGFVKIWHFRPTNEESRIIGAELVQNNPEVLQEEISIHENNVVHMDIDQNNQNI